MDNEKILNLVRSGLTDEIVEKLQPNGTWLICKALHESDYSDLLLPTNVDYSFCLFHQVMKAGPEATYKPGDVVIVIKNALDGLTADRHKVAVQQEDCLARVEL